MGHLGADRTLQFLLIKDKFYWPKMGQDIRYFISNICPCVRQKKRNIQPAAPLVPISSSSSPLEIIGIDFLHLEKSSGRCEYILLLTDHFTRYSQAYPPEKNCQNSHQTLAQWFHIKIPSKLLHDQWGEFENEVLKHLVRHSKPSKNSLPPLN